MPSREDSGAAGFIALATPLPRRLLPAGGASPGVCPTPGAEMPVA